MQTMCRLGEIEDVVEEMDLSEIPDDVLELDDGYQLVISGWYVWIPELSIRLHEGVVGYWDEEMQGYMPDFSVTAVFPEEPTETDYIYYEQDGIIATMANWLHGRMSIDMIGQLRCEIVIPHE